MQGSHGASSRSRRRYARHARPSSVMRTRLRATQLAEPLFRRPYLQGCCLLRV
ncbi:hypothetical protein STVIR_8669 [Streptomyces viridochromogenes Tue57]|uniref:Uncharacterized protein n=1 Tax=Streptomyces viridochromogenes Tue57 TaxID=1160705 RepID=L8P4X6_STRVR|nr:hypothetical protein STVIR_8669 [Streptomyces viridochromogenes Tue57]